MPTVSGQISVADLVDGQTGATIVLENESHTFVADSDGVVTSGELGMYSSTVAVYGGSTAFTYQDAATPTANNRWTIGGSADVSGEAYRSLNVSPSSTDLQLRIADSNGALTLVDRGTSSSGFVDASGADSAVITIPVVVQINGNDITYNRSVSLAKALGGSAPYIRMRANRQTQAYAFGATDTRETSNLVFTANSFNITGTPTGVWSYSTDGSSFTNITANSGSGSVTGHTFAGANTATSTLTVTPAGWNTVDGSSQVVTYRFTRSSQIDQISVFRLTDAEGGITVVVESIAGNPILKNNPTYNSSDATTYVDLRARIYRAGVEITSGLTYAWSKNGTAIPASGTGSLQVTQPSNYGRTNDRIRVGGADVTDGGTEVFSCAITY